jgi:hypothetical protein
MVKCFKLPGIQVCIGFDVFLRGCLRGQNRVVSRGKHSIFTIARNAKSPKENYLLKKIFTFVESAVDNRPGNRNYILNYLVDERTASGLKEKLTDIGFYLFGFSRMLEIFYWTV